MSEIDFSPLHPLTARQITEALRRDGFVRETPAGSHQQYYHPDGRRVTVSYHRPGQTFSIRMLRNMIQAQARRNWADLRRLGLVKPCAVPNQLTLPISHWSFEQMKTYRFRIELQPDGDGWFVRCPALERYGAATWGETPEQAHRHIKEVLAMVLESMLELGIPVPEDPGGAFLREAESLAVTV